MIEECVIIGGGVAGLSAANQLADSGLHSLIIDAGSYPAHRICGEFISHECLPILQRWNIPLTAPITQCRFVKDDHQVEFPLPIYAKSCSRWTLDTKLIERAKEKGVRALTNTRVISLQPPKDAEGHYELLLSNGQTVKANHLMIGTGRIPNENGVISTLPHRYFGFKAHFEGIQWDSAIEMQLFDGGYLGISRLDEQTTNIACLIKKEFIDDSIPLQLFVSQFLQRLKSPIFKERLSKARMLFPQWLIGQLPEFGIRKNPVWERVFWIGDSAGSIPPISGDGLALGVTSGCMAAEYLLNSNAEQFQKDWLKRVKKRFFYAKQLHNLMLRPRFSILAIELGNMLPFVPRHLWKATRE